MLVFQNKGTAAILVLNTFFSMATSHVSAMMESLEVLTETATRTLRKFLTVLFRATQNESFQSHNTRKSLDLRDFSLVFSNEIFIRRF